MISDPLKSCLSGLIIGLTAIVFSISFTAIIYTGDLAPFLSRGIGLTLAGAAVMAVVGAFTLSYRGTIVQPQDVTALILSLAGVSIATGWQDPTTDDLFATIAVLVAVASAATGAATIIFGHLRFGHVVRFIPYPVLGGFLAATGYLLVTGAIGMALRDNVSIWSANVLFAPGNPEKWVPWLIAAVLFYIAVTLSSPYCAFTARSGFSASISPRPRHTAFSSVRLRKQTSTALSILELSSKHGGISWQPNCHQSSPLSAWRPSVRYSMFPDLNWRRVRTLIRTENCVASGSPILLRRWLAG